MKRKLFSALLCICLFVNTLGVFGAEPEIEIIPHEKSPTWLIASTVSDKLYTGKGFATKRDNTLFLTYDGIHLKEITLENPILTTFFEGYQIKP